MGKKESDEHLAAVAEGLSEMHHGLFETHVIFGGAWGKTSSAFKQLNEVLSLLLNKTIGEGFNIGSQHLTESIYGLYGEATTHLVNSGITESAPVDTYSRTIAESLVAFEGKTAEFRVGIMSLVSRIKQLQEQLDTATVSCERARESNIELLRAEDGGILWISDQVIDAQRLQQQLNTPEE